MSIIERIFKKPYFGLIMAAYLAAVMIGGTWFFLQKRLGLSEMEIYRETYERKEYLSAMREDLRAISQRNDIRMDTIEKIIASRRQAKDANEPDTSVAIVRIEEIDEKIEGIGKDVESLKRAFNPTKPNEILSIARLGDKFELIGLQISNFESKIEDLKKTTDQNIQQNYVRMEAQVDRVINMLKWLGLILIPVILNTFRDFLRGRSVESPRPTKK
jgi:hypothetical protein